MTKTYKLIEMAKRNLKIDSDYEFGKLIGVTPQKVSNWKNEKYEANGEHMLKIVATGKIKIEEAVRVMESGNAQLSLIFVTAMASIALLASFLKPLHCILC